LLWNVAIFYGIQAARICRSYLYGLRDGSLWQWRQKARIRERLWNTRWFRADQLTAAMLETYLAQFGAEVKASVIGRE
jgi:hypothetical protein